MFDSELRVAKDRLLSLIIRPFQHIHPITITMLSFTAGLGAVYLLVRGITIAALVLWALNRILDGLDGLVARSYGKQSDSGGYIDIIADFIIYSAIPLAISIRLGSSGSFLAAAVLLGSFYINGAVWMSGSALMEKRRTRGDARGSTSMIMPRGLIEGFETIVFFTLMMLLPGSFSLLAYIMAGLTFAGGLLRFFQTLSILQK